LICDAQIGETIVKKRVEAALGRPLEKAKSARNFQYKAPEFIAYSGPKLNTILTELQRITFLVDGAGKVETPSFLEALKIRLGDTVYAMGIGGLHSTEANRALRSDDKRVLIDVDVASQYPNIIRKLGLYPEALGPAFLDIYGKLIDERLAAKDAGDKVKADGGRIALNGVYGKLGNIYSLCYGPHLLIATTLTGQLSILMLIERAEIAGIPVVSGNTDGIVFFCPRDREDDLAKLLVTWESDTGFKVEKTRYDALFNSSVNTYIALREGGGKAKRKGTISNPWKKGEEDFRGQMSKNPHMSICSEAILNYVTSGKPVEDTIRESTDPREFITIVKVSGGAVWRSHPLGRAVRYYWSLDGDPIFYANGLKKVSNSYGSKPLMELTDQLPPDLDYSRYYEETIRLGSDLGISL
jgi:hypothetical protein